MKRCVLNVATGKHYVAGQKRLSAALTRLAPEVPQIFWEDSLPDGSPGHEYVPYAFKAWAITHAVNLGYDEILWADSSILPIQPLDRIWERAEVHGAWIGRNGYRNTEWTADSAYRHLFPVLDYEEARKVNYLVEHVVATAFCLNVATRVGQDIARNYIRLAKSGAFEGPWDNLDRQPDPPAPGPRAGRCGPPDCRGHRHDQTALSVCAFTFKLELTSSPDYFAYYGGETSDTILSADGGHQRAVGV